MSRASTCTIPRALNLDVTNIAGTLLNNEKRKAFSMVDGTKVTQFRDFLSSFSLFCFHYVHHVQINSNLISANIGFRKMRNPRRRSFSPSPSKWQIDGVVGGEASGKRVKRKCKQNKSDNFVSSPFSADPLPPITLN